ncbi:MAG: N-acetylglucosamine-6-phosphate deacetylase [Clostridia bacterium]|nr:N-acetylglucosamine-6-phosphate deacetylase [Clostridia bacterium]
MYTVFKNGFVYNTDLREFVRADVLCENGIIADADCKSVPADAEVVDCTGLYMIPGLVDVHSHGRTKGDFNYADEDGVRALRKSYAASGTTTLMATLASDTKESLLASMEAIGRNRTVEPGTATIAGTHLEGRYLNPKRRGAHATELLCPLDAEELTEFIGKMLPLPIHVSCAPEMEGGETFIKTAKSFGATCGMVHSDATYEESMNAVAWGVTSFTHTYNAMRPIHHREPGNMVASLLTDSAYSEFIVDGEHSHPMMIAMASRLKPADKLILVTDSMEAAGCEDGEYAIAGLPVYVQNGRAVNSEGALAGSTLDLFTAVCNYMKFTGKTLEETVPCATSNPAAMLGIGNLCGKIANGLRADFVLIENKESPVRKAVYAGGVRV